MNELRFIWSDEKANQNERKHRVPFKEAQSIFDDPDVLLKPDIEHSFNEDRVKALGLSSRMRLLIVVFVEVDEDVFRIISARRATAAESNEYAKRKAQRH